MIDRRINFQLSWPSPCPLPRGRGIENAGFEDEAIIPSILHSRRVFQTEFLATVPLATASVARSFLATEFLAMMCLTTVFLTTTVMPMDAHMAAADDISHEVGKIKAKSLREISGVAASRNNPDILWMHNDGESKHVYAANTSGKIVLQIVLDVHVEDMEGIAIGPGPEKGVDYIYLGDIGDNDSKRHEIRVIRFVEPSLQGDQEQPSAVNSQVFRFVYPDGPRDAEALMVDSQTGDLLIASKGKKETRVYAAPLEGLRGDRLTMLKLVAILGVDNVSAGDISRDGSSIVLRREETGWLWNRHNGESLQAAPARQPRKIPVLGKKQAKNGEAIAFHPDGRGYFTLSEGRQGSIYLFELPTRPNP